MIDIPVEDLNSNERKAVFFYEGIKSLWTKAKETNKLKEEDEYKFFTHFFFLFLILSGNNKEVKDVILNLKEDDLKEDGLSNDEINSYISKFNGLQRNLAASYMKASEGGKSDEEFTKIFFDEVANSLTNSLGIVLEEAKNLIIMAFGIFEKFKNI